MPRLHGAPRRCERHRDAPNHGVLAASARHVGSPLETHVDTQTGPPSHLRVVIGVIP